MTEPTPRASSTTSPADEDHDSTSAAPDDAQIAGISDEQLPEDLQPGDDNPLAKPLDPDDAATKDPDELGMKDTQEDADAVQDSSEDSSEESNEDSNDADADAASVSGDGAQGAGISG